MSEDLSEYANSEYQLEVAKLKLEGKTNVEMAESLNRTVESIKAALRTMRARKNGKRSEVPISEKFFSDQQLLSIITLHEGGANYTEIADIMGVSAVTIGEFMRGKSYKKFWDSHDKTGQPVASGELASPEIKRKKITGKRFVFTAAQNNTHIHRNFLKSLERYCEHNNAQLIVSTFTYNKNGFQNLTKADEDLWYDPSIIDYIINEPLEICPDLYFCGELNILPTAVNPLSGFNNYTGSASAIIPHTKVQLESIATPKNDPAKLLYTTGAITQRNYIQKKAGQIAEWHHVYGATLVEIDDEDDWFVRQLIADSDTGCFCDLGKRYEPKKVVTDMNTTLAINWGDIHVAQLDEEVADASWRDTDSMLHQLKPEYQFVHDVYDQQARNHHNVNDPHLNFELFMKGSDSVKDELMKTTEELLLMSAYNESKVVVVDSNHDRALERWLKEADYRRDPVNALIFLQLQSAKYKAISEGNTDFHLFEHAVGICLDELKAGGVDAEFNGQFLRLDEPFRLSGIEFGAHGDMGANGSRGTPKSFAQQGVKFNTGHSHSAKIYQGVYTAGVSGTLKMSYSKGSSSWSASHIITYHNGKRTIVTLKKSKKTGRAKWRA